jgi:hypothetical protein
MTQEWGDCLGLPPRSGNGAGVSPVYPHDGTAIGMKTGKPQTRLSWHEILCNAVAFPDAGARLEAMRTLKGSRLRLNSCWFSG